MMKAIGKVVKLEHEDGFMGDTRGWVMVTVKLWGGDHLTVRLRPHDAKPYPLGRKVDVEFGPRKQK